MKHFFHHRGESVPSERQSSSDPETCFLHPAGEKDAPRGEEGIAVVFSSDADIGPDALLSGPDGSSEEKTGMLQAAPMPEKKHALWILFREFFKIALFVVGGGFAILLVAEDVFVRKYPWLREGELSDMLALIQTVPGLTAGNVAIYVGYRVAGLSGALTALTAVALPSFLVITLVAMGFALIPMESAFVRGAFLGVRTAMTGLMLVALARIWKGSVRSPVQLLIFLAGIAGVVVFHVNPGWLIAGALLAGVLYCMGICRVFPRALPKGGI